MSLITWERVGDSDRWSLSEQEMNHLLGSFSAVTEDLAHTKELYDNAIKRHQEDVSRMTLNANWFAEEIERLEKQLTIAREALEKGCYCVRSDGTSECDCCEVLNKLNTPNVGEEK